MFSDESCSDSPSLEVLRSHPLQRKVDKRLRELEQSSQSTGKDNLMFKSQRGGVDVQVNHKVSWPQEDILGGATGQRLNYDQLTLTQFIQGFCRNVLEEADRGHRDTMIAELSDLMEDATDFSWQGVKGVEFPAGIDAYIDEEIKYDAILGPFKEKPIAGGHCTPFMTRAKPNSDRRQVTVDLSWPLGASVNAGIDNNSYLDTNFSLTFPADGDITDQVKQLGHTALLNKVDVSHMLSHIKVDPSDFDLGLEWQGHYVNTGFTIIDYIDDYVKMDVPSIASRSSAALMDLMKHLGLTISEKKLVPPVNQVMCLGVLIDTECGSIAIPPYKLRDMTMQIWLTQEVASKRQLQYILGLLLHVHQTWMCFSE